MKFYHYFNQADWVGCEEYKLLKETPKGYWIIPTYDAAEDAYRKRWIPKESLRRFAYPTKAEALYSFKMRKKCQIELLTSQLKFAKIALAKAENGEIEE